MNHQCLNCGRIVALQGKQNVEILVDEEWRRTRPEKPEKVYLCRTCVDEDPKLLDVCMNAPWYGGHGII